MKKVLFIAIAAVVFTACQKEQKPLIAIPQKEDITTELAAMKTKITKSDMVTVVDQTTSGFRCTKPPVTCSPIPVALGASIPHDTVLIKGSEIIGVVDAYIAYRFYSGGSIIKSKMSVQTSYIINNDPTRQVDSKIFNFNVSSTLNSFDYGMFVVRDLKVPVNTAIIFTVKGYNNCGETSTLTFIYSFGYNNTAKVASENQRAIGLIGNATTIGTKTNE